MLRMPLRKGRSPVTGTAATSTPHQAAATVPHIVAPIGTFLAPTTTYVSVPRIPQDPLTACLDANGTYICTAYNSRCLIIQKVSGLEFLQIIPYVAKDHPIASVTLCAQNVVLRPSKNPIYPFLGDVIGA